jgi:hypothetical protein
LTQSLFKQTTNRANSIIGILRNIDNPKLLFVGEKTENHETTKAFIYSDDLKTTMEEARVIPKPKIHLMNISHFKILKYFNYKLRICKHTLLKS